MIEAPPDQTARRRSALLLGSVFVVATCGLVYELLAGALSSYLVGSSITYFSLVIGLFMFAMGIGSFLSRYVREEALTVFVGVEVAVGLAGGGSGLLLFYAFTFLDLYLPYLIMVSLLVGSLVGLEIPLVIRVLKERQAFASAVSSVLALDYVGALLASLLFPLVLVPYLGLVRTGFLFGLLNVVVAGLALWLLADEIKRLRTMRAVAGGVGLLLLVGLVTAGGLTRLAEDHLYQDPILLARDSPYQRIVITRWRDDVRLFLNGHLQFSSVDEARYHEALVHPAMAAVPTARRVLILGGGDGMVAREVFKHAGVEQVDLVDLDPEVTRLFSDREMLRRLNQGALDDPRLRLHNMDAAKFLERSHDAWDVIIADLPDPSSAQLARLYSKSFYAHIRRRLSAHGAFVTQATSPFFAADAFWCIVRTVEDSLTQHQAYPYHVNVPSFGEWGFVLASARPLDLEQLRLPTETRFLSQDMVPSLFMFPRDMQRRAVEPNRLNRPVVTRYYERGWSHYNN